MLQHSVIRLLLHYGYSLPTKDVKQWIGQSIKVGDVKIVGVF